MLTTASYLILLAFSRADNLQANLNTVQYTLGLVTPSGNLLRALLLTLNQSQILCDGQSYRNPGAISVYGAPILYLVLQCVALYAFLVSYDSGYFSRFAPRFISLVRFPLRPKNWDDTRKHYPSTDTILEAKRTEQSPGDALRVLHLSKAVSRTSLAVLDVTFGVKSSESFALLGPNGMCSLTKLKPVLC